MAKITIGITGGIGCGKSVVSRTLRCNGFFVYDCDSSAKKIMVSDNSVIFDLQTRLGKDIYIEDGSLNKEKMSRELFSNEEVRQYVNNVVHRAVTNDIQKKRNDIDGLFFIESAILAGSGLVHFCDLVWEVKSPVSLRIERIKKRDNLSDEEILKRIESQKNENQLLKHYNLVTLENDDYHSILSQIKLNILKIINFQFYTISC